MSGGRVRPASMTLPPIASTHKMVALSGESERRQGVAVDTTAGVRGSRTVIVVPAPVPSLSASICPPWASTIALLIVSPMPAPWSSRCCPHGGWVRDWLVRRP